MKPHHRVAPVEEGRSAAPSEPSPPATGPRKILDASTRLVETPTCTVDWDRRRSLVRFARTERVYASIMDLDHDGTEVARALERAGRARLLVDLRAAAPRNDPQFEAAIARFRRKLFGGRRPTAILVRTAVGALQVKRHMREDGYAVEVFSQEEEALAYLEAVAPESAPEDAGDRMTPPPSPRKRGPFRAR